MTATAINQAAWNTQARLALPHDTTQNSLPRLEWTQHPETGPGFDVLEPIQPGSHIVELGCGGGDNTAALTTTAATHIVGVDTAEVQLKRARARWPHLPITWAHTDAAGYLTSPGPAIDVAVSIFGAIGLTDPHTLLPLLAKRLAACGRVVFSVPDPAWLTQQPGHGQHLHHPNGQRSPVARWALTPRQWETVAASCQLTTIDTISVPDPYTHQPCCHIITLSPT